MKQPETEVMPVDAQASERIAEFERLLAAALRRILAERAPTGAGEPTRASTPGDDVGPGGGGR